MNWLRYIFWNKLTGGGGKNHVIPAQEGTNGNVITFTPFNGTYGTTPNGPTTYTLDGAGDNIWWMTFYTTFNDGTSHVFWMWVSDTTFKVKRTPSAYTFTASSYTQDGKTVYYWVSSAAEGDGEIQTDASEVYYNTDVNQRIGEHPWEAAYRATTAWLMVYGGY